jgi:hypothetical protein
VLDLTSHKQYVRDGFTLSILWAEYPMLSFVELIYVTKKHEKLTLAC